MASAVLPMVENGRPLGVIVLDFREPHHFTPDEEHFLLTLAGQCALALDRARLSGNLEQQVQDRTAELEAFVRFTELADGETDVLALAARAGDVLGLLFPGSTTCYYVLDNDLWKLKVYSRDLEDSPALLSSLKAGLPIDTPVFAQQMQTGEPVFVNAWDAAREQVAMTEVYQRVATYPLYVDGTIRRSSPWAPAHRELDAPPQGGVSFGGPQSQAGPGAHRDHPAAPGAARSAPGVQRGARSVYLLGLARPADPGAAHRQLRWPAAPLDAGAAGREDRAVLQDHRDRAATLNELIDGILDLSRTSRQPLKMGRVDLGRLVDRSAKS